MIPLKLPANADQITATVTATSAPDLIRATSGNTVYQIPSGFNTIILQAEDGNVRYSLSNDPTTAIGVRLTQGNSVQLDKIDFDKLILIRDDAADVKVNIQIFQNTI